MEDSDKNLAKEENQEPDFADACIDRFLAGEDLRSEVWDIYAKAGLDECDHWFYWVKAPTKRLLREYFVEQAEPFSWETVPKSPDEPDDEEEDDDGWEDEPPRQDYATLTEEQKESLLDEYYDRCAQGDAYKLIEVFELKGASGRSIWISAVVGDRGLTSGCFLDAKEEDISSHFDGYYFD
jgi:hypothetical protein